MMRYEITPVAAPRQVRSDQWNPRPQVKKYRAFRDQVRLQRVAVPQEGTWVTFVLPMPASWPKYKRSEMDGEPHCQKPDIDNLLKALLDSVYGDDCGVHEISARKVCGRKGAIIVEAS